MKTIVNWIGEGQGKARYNAKMLLLKKTSNVQFVQSFREKSQAKGGSTSSINSGLISLYNQGNNSL